MRDTAASTVHLEQWHRVLRLPIGCCGALALACDVVAIMGGGLCAAIWYQGGVLGGTADLPTLFGTQICLALMVIVAQGFGRSKASDVPFTNLREQLFRLAGIWIAAHLFFLVIVFLLKVQHLSRGVMLASFLAGLAALLILRTLLHRVLRDSIASGRMQARPIALFHDAEDAHLIEQLRRNGHRVARNYSLAKADTPDAEALRGEIAAQIDDLRQLNVSEVIISVDWHDSDKLEVLLNALRALPTRVRLVPRTNMPQIIGQAVAPIGRHLAIDVQRQPLSPSDEMLKRMTDVGLAATGLVLLSPLLMLVALLIKLDSTGPVLFRQTRIGFNGQPFRIYKFRSMKVMEDGPTIRQATRDDDRITRIGRILRRTSIDELPQLLNVLLGHMSLVGPRPHARAHDDEYSRQIDRYFFRHHVKPGITGWAQIHGSRGATHHVGDMERRVLFDLWYIDHWSLWLDFKIMFLTAIKITRMTDAY
jgi:Undecaprenyl-phosphate glucose phosphotransferase